MRLYFIDRPSVSSGFQRTYHKKLEVFSGEFTTGKGSGTVKADKVFRYSPKKGIWEEKPYKGSVHRYIHNEEQIVEQLPPLMRISDYTVFTSLELAQVAKLLLIEYMGMEYKKALKELREAFDRNVPDVETPLSKMKNELPELFI